MHETAWLIDWTMRNCLIDLSFDTKLCSSLQLLAYLNSLLCFTAPQTGSHLMVNVISQASNDFQQGSSDQA